jgi:poly(3-hydroxyalkanoate) depolymerase
VVRPPHIRLVEVGGLAVRTCVRGEGSPLLLLTGIGASLEMWEPFEQALEGLPIQTISIDLPGTGGSPPPSKPMRMPALARLLVGVLDALGYTTVDLLGVSFGGALAQQLAHQAPDRINRLVLVATAPGVPGLGGVPGHPRALIAMATPRRYYDPAYLRDKGHMIYGGPPLPPVQRIEDDARFRLPPSVRGYLFQLWAIQAWTAFPWLHTLKQPTLIIAGDDDRILPLPNARILAWRIPRAQLEVVSGGGHLFLLQRPKHVVSLLRDFLLPTDAQSPDSTSS